MSGLRLIAKNTTLLTMTQVSYVLFTLIYNIFLTRILGPSQFGLFFFALSFSSVFTLLFTFRIDGLLVRKISRKLDEIKHYLGNAILFHIILGILTLLLLNFSAIIVKNALKLSNFPILLLNILSIHFILSTISLDIESAFRSSERMEFILISTLLERGVLLLSGILLLKHSPTPISGALPFIIGSLFRLTFNVIIIHFIYNAFSLGLRKVILKELIKKGYIFAIGTFISFLFDNSNTLILSALMNTGSVGIYGSCIIIITAIAILGRSFANSLYPKMLKISTIDTTTLDTLTSKAIPISMFGASFFSIGVFYGTTDLIVFLYGNEYLSAIPFLQLLAFTFPILFVLPVLRNYLLSEMKEKKELIISIFSGLSGIVASIPMILIFGIYGAVLSYFFALLMNLGLRFLILGRKLRIMILKVIFWLLITFVFIWMLLFVLEMVITLHWVLKTIISWFVILVVLFGTSREMRMQLISLTKG